ncbi:MAG: autotransporter-associated beta strand repeat-containing protein [Tepidisphaeraceae bacterium]
MKRSTKRTLGLAVASVMASGSFLSPASANTYTWTTTAGSQDWNTAANWSSTTVPGSGDTAFFNVSPPSNTVNLSSPASVGAIFAEVSPTPSLMTIGGGHTITLYGQTITVPQFNQTLTNEANVVLALGNNTLAAQNNALTVSDNLALNGAQNVMIASSLGDLSAHGQVVTLSGSISNAGATPAQVTLLGGGTPSDFGAEFVLSGSNTFTGGLTIGNTAATEGAEVSVTPSAIPGSGTIIVNEQSQLLLNGPGTYGTGTTLDLNGPGIGPGVSQGSSGALRTKGSGSFAYAGTVNIGTSTSGSSALGYVVISSTGTNTLTFSGAVTGSGNIQKQGGGDLILSGSGSTWSGGTQIGNGALDTEANSSIGTGDLIFACSSTNTTTVNLRNATQSIGNLNSTYNASTFGSGDSDTQVLNLFGTALTINGTKSGVVQGLTGNTFGYGFGGGLTSTIQDGPSTHGSVIYHGTTSTAQLNLTGPNTYSGGTTVTGGILNVANGYNGSSFGVNGSALGTGNVTVNSGGTLSSGDGVSVLGQTVTAGGFTGNLIVNSGGIVAPGGVGEVGSLSTGALTANGGSAFDFDLAGGTTAQFDTINVNGSATLSGTDTINIAGDKIAYTAANSPIELMSFTGGLVNPGTSFTLGTTPNGHNRVYSLTTNSSGVFLNISDTGNERIWSLGGVSPSSSTDGAGTWANAPATGSVNFYNTDPPMTGTQEPYANNSTADVIFGSGGNGGTVTLGTAITVGGDLVFSQVNTPYTIGASGGTNALTLTNGIVALNNATIAAPVILSAAQTFTASAGSTLTINGGISEANAGTQLTFGGDTGTVVLGGTNTYTGGTVVSQGVLQTSTASLPATGTLQDNASLVFSQASSGTYSGQITGSGSVTVANPGSATVTLGNASNSYSGATNIQSGVLSVSSVGALGTGAGGINLSGGTLQFNAPLNFPLGSPSQTITLLPGTTSTIDTDGFNTTLGQDLIGQSGNLTKIGGGTLTVTGLIPTDAIGDLSILGGAVNFYPGGGSGGASYSINASSSPGTFTGDLILSGSLEMRLLGGDINGGGKVRIVSSGVNLISHGAVEIDNQIVLNENNVANFVADIGATASNTLTITSAITNPVGTTADVDFTNGAGITYLQGQSTYNGTTTIDNSTGGEVQLDVNNALPTGTDVHITSSGVLDVYGVTQTIGSLDSGAPGTGAEVIDESNNNATLIINGSKSTNFAGLITDNSGAGGGSLTIELGSSYSGTLTLNSGTINDYAGGTILNGGTLVTPNDGLLGYSTGGLTFGGGTLAVTTSFSTARPITVNPGNSSIDVASGMTLSVNSSALTWAGGTLATTDSGSVSIAQTSGPIAVTPGSIFSVASTSSVTVSGSVDPFTDSSNSSHHVAVVNNGIFDVVNVNSSIAGITGTGALSIGGGSVANRLQLAVNSGLSTQDSLTIAANSALDITNNHMIITYGSNPDPVAAIRTYLINGRNGGSWNGMGGIDSSVAALPANSAYSIGYADSADFGNPAGLSSGTIEVKYTLLGDATLTGTVTGTDFTILATNLGKTVSGWDQGDFLYTGTVTGSDFTALVTNLGKTASGSDVALPASVYTAVDAFAAANGLMADVPEPASASLILIASMGVLARRRRSVKA